MAGDCVCVGGVDIDNHRSVRLLDASGHHEYANLCPYQIWDIWDIDYHMSHKRPSPHTEDANVTRRDKIRTANPSDLPVERLASFLERSGIPIFRGSLFKVFEGKLKRTDYDKLFISKEDVPAYSTCFWVNDRRLIGYNNERGRRQYRYNDMSNMYGYTISYVGAAEPPSNIEAGSLIRLSLAHWWSPDDSNDEERCYLQLSGCLIQGKADELAAVPEEIETQSGKIDTTCKEEDRFVGLPVKEALNGITCKLKITSSNHNDSPSASALSLSLSKPFHGQDELILSKEVMESIFGLLRSCIVSYDNTSEKYHITLSQTERCNDIESVVKSEPPSHIEAQKAIYANAYTPWSEEDDKRLEELFHEGKSIEELMHIFQRNHGSITSRLRKLGLTV